MIILENNIQDVVIRKTITNYEGRYGFLILHNQTRVYKFNEVVDISEDKIFYKFNIEIPEEFPFGEYNFWILPYYDFIEYNFNIADIRKSCYIDIKDMNPLANYDVPICNYDIQIVNYDESNSNIGCNNINILYTGIIQYFSKQEAKSYNNPQQFKQYERSR